MLTKTRSLLIAVLLMVASRASAQFPPSQPVPAAPPIDASAPGVTIERPNPFPAQPPVVVGQPVPYSTLPPPGPPPTTYLPPVLRPNESLFFFDYELEFVKPSVSNHLNNSVTLPNGTQKEINLPGADLGFTVAPEFEIGYRLPDQQGQFSAAYRFLSSSGSETDTIGGVGTDVRSRFDFNQLDFDYGTRRYEIKPHLFLQARVGARVLWSYYDSTGTTPVFEDRESNYFDGAGPHGSLDLEYKVIEGFGVFGKVDGAVLIGQADQRYWENTAAYFTVTEPPRKTLTVPMIQAQLGLSYSPPRFEWLRFRAGYQFEQWFNLGDVSGTSANVIMQGGFFRGEIDF